QVTLQPANVGDDFLRVEEDILRLAHALTQVPVRLRDRVPGCRCAVLRALVSRPFFSPRHIITVFPPSLLKQAYEVQTRRHPGGMVSDRAAAGCGRYPRSVFRLRRADNQVEGRGELFVARGVSGGPGPIDREVRSDLQPAR